MLAGAVFVWLKGFLRVLCVHRFPCFQHCEGCGVKAKQNAQTPFELVSARRSRLRFVFTEEDGEIAAGWGIFEENFNRAQPLLSCFTKVKEDTLFALWGFRWNIRAARMTKLKWAV